VALLTGGLLVAAAPAKDPRPAVLGTWRGTSLCVRIPGNEACNDEQVVYEIAPLGAARDTVFMKADKIVAGKRQPMGEMPFGYEPKTGAWTHEFRSPRFHGVWSFTVHGDRMTGVLLDLPDSTVFRHVDVARDTTARQR
jgi:hypothetical protein